MRILLPLVMLFAMMACSKPPKMPTDFYFKITDDINSYDSRTGEYTRKAVDSTFRDTTIVVKLSHDELERIYQIMTENYALNLPDEFDCVPNSEYVIPAFKTVLQFQIGKRFKKVLYDDGCQSPVDRWAAKKFTTVDSTIRSVLEANPLISKLPETKLFFL